MPLAARSLGSVRVLGPFVETPHEFGSFWTQPPIVVSILPRRPRAGNQIMVCHCESERPLPGKARARQLEVHTAMPLTVGRRSVQPSCYTLPVRPSAHVPEGEVLRSRPLRRSRPGLAGCRLVAPGSMPQQALHFEQKSSSRILARAHPSHGGTESSAALEN